MLGLQSLENIYTFLWIVSVLDMVKSERLLGASASSLVADSLNPLRESASESSLVAGH